MTWSEALDVLADRDAAKSFSPVARYRELCRDDNPDALQRDGYRQRVVDQAEGRPPVRPAPPSYPPVTTMIGAALGAVGRTVTAVARGESPTVDEVEQARRLAICHKCDRYVAADDRCSVCGCVARWKSRLRYEHCPLPEPKW
jgi:hypothetical protein